MPTMTPSAPSAVTHGAALAFETLAAGQETGVRVHLDEDTLLRVVAGIVRLVVDDAERLLGPGDEAIVPAGAPHVLASAAACEARLVSGWRPARR
jgi:mannose-6-phosphate isomerase-like protein (cupin superfamily)